MAIYGYARISTSQQSLDYQIQSLIDYPIDPSNIYSDIFTGKEMSRTGIDTLLRIVTTGDTLVVTKFDRLGRNLKGLIDMFETLQKRDIRLVSLTQSFDTNTATGRLLFHIMGALAEFERELTKERTYYALQRAKQTKKLGRPTSLNPEKIEAVQSLQQQGKSGRYICKVLNISLRTYYRYFPKSVCSK